jgi:hypothetical protein
MNKDTQIKGMANPNRGSVGAQEAQRTEQEPVAWEQFHGHMAGPFYQEPPQRTWVGLTDYEIGVCSTEAAMNRSEMVGGAVTFARAIEAKLKEKNT